MRTPIATDPFSKPRFAEVRALGLALALLAMVIAFVSSCGTDDLVFPGQIPFTATPAPGTSTPTTTQ